uniref:LRAT domain-containing protein n=1 Tax=Sinocyclocheilus grahami TaxID=75366 RepID=A0A672LBX5_SINGR
MKSLGKKLVLIILFLQPCLAVENADYLPFLKSSQLEFGDMLEFPRCGIYSHYAVYVDNVPIQGKKDGEDIFEMTSTTCLFIHEILTRDFSKYGTYPSGCRFHKLTGNYNKRNYLDREDLLPQNWQDIRDTIEYLINGECGKWSPTNNCEHIATYVRYGEANAQSWYRCWTNMHIFQPLKKHKDAETTQRKPLKTNILKNLHQSELATAA